MTWMPLDTWIVVVGALCAASCALLGNYLVLRKMSMMGDAISHAVLPGLAVAYLLSGSRGSLVMFAGAAAVGLLTALLVSALQRAGQMDEGASMGVVFTLLFALGLVLIRRAADHVDLDPGCVLYGALELTPLDTLTLAGLELPRAALVNGVMLLLNLLFVLLFYKELKLSSFDPALATALGISAPRMHYLLMAMVAATTVAAFESVGSILVIAMLIVPGATAYLLTDRLRWMIVGSLAVAVLSALVGHWAAVALPARLGYSDTSTAGMMAATAGGLFVLAFLLAPRQGVVGRAAQRGLLSLRIAREDVLGLLFRHEEVAAAGPSGPELVRVLGRPWLVRLALWDLLRRRHVARAEPLDAPGGAGYRLTDLGQAEAGRLIRSHRLWETYLVEVLGQRPEEAHDGAMRVEHVIDDSMRGELERLTGFPERDPHDKAIPPAS